MNEHIEAEAEEAMKKIRESDCYSTDVPKAVTRQYLEAIRDAIDLEIECMGEEE